MPHKTLRDLLGARQVPAPYTNDIIKIKVVKVGHTVNYTTSSGENIQIMNFSIADETAAMVASLNDSSKQRFIQDKNNLHIRNFIVKNDKIVMTARTKIFQGQPVAVPNDIMEHGVLLIVPRSPTKTIKDATSSPLKSIMTVQGQIVKDEAVKTVQVNGVDTPIRIIQIKDDEDEIDITLWRDLTLVDLKINQYIEISQCIKGEWQNKASLNSTRNTSIKHIEPPVTTVRGRIEGITIFDTTVEISVKTVQEDYAEFKVRTEILKEAFDIQTDDVIEIERAIIALLPIEVELSLEGTNVVSLSWN